MSELKTMEYFVTDGLLKQYTIFEYTEYHAENETVIAQDGIPGLKRYETNEGFAVNRLDEDSFIVFDGVDKIKVQVKLKIYDDRLT